MPQLFVTDGKLCAVTLTRKGRAYQLFPVFMVDRHSDGPLRVRRKVMILLAILA
jgi:hypothetical protein